MKKILAVLCVLLMLVGCQNKPKDNGFEIKCEDIDMSYYDGVSKDSCFKLTKLSEMDRCLKEGGSGIFYFGYVDCVYCQSLVKYMNQVGQELGVTIYYIDAFDKDEGYFDNEEMFKDDLYTILRQEDGEIVVYTPHVFTIINGIISKSQISAEDWDLMNPTLNQINEIKKIYRDMFKPFVS